MSPSAAPGVVAYDAFRDRMYQLHRSRNDACSICGRRHIDYFAPANTTNAYELHHTPIARVKALRMGRPDLITDPANVAASAHVCNRGLGARDAAPAVGEISERW